MILYRFAFSDGYGIRHRLTFACPPALALPWASAYARAMRCELLAIRELRPLTPQLELR